MRVCEKSLTARFVTDADTYTHTERIYGCLSMFYHCFKFLTDLWMASFNPKYGYEITWNEPSQILGYLGNTKYHTVSITYYF